MKDCFKKILEITAIVMAHTGTLKNENGKAMKEGRKELVLFDRNKQYRLYMKTFCQETPTKAQPLSLSWEPPTCHNT